jgi:hypothetical protein
MIEYLEEKGCAFEEIKLHALTHLPNLERKFKNLFPEPALQMLESVRTIFS